MSFVAPLFPLLFLVALVLSGLLRERWSRLVLLGVSYVFYGFAHPAYCLLLLASSLIDYLAGERIARARQAGGRGRTAARAWLALSIIANLGLLGYFKYVNFGIDLLNRGLFDLGAFALPPLEIVLPVGISFYTFQSMSYTIDVYRGLLHPRSRFSDFALYVAFFPQLVAGPIVRATHFFAQLDAPRRVDRQDITVGVTRILIGLFRKLVLADHLALLVERVFANYQMLGPAEIALGSVAFGFQIYFDFAAYSDIARGLARLLGFEFEINFLYPMAARNISEHWARWHISLTTWFRDYLYIPLGGSRHGALRLYWNSFLIWALTGLWHGADYHFVFSGIWQWVMLTVHREYGRTRLCALLNERGGRLYDLIARATTIFFLSFGWIMFRAPSMEQAWVMIGRLFGLNDLPALLAGSGGAVFWNGPGSGALVSWAPLMMFLFAYEYLFARLQLEYFFAPEHRWRLVGLLAALVFAVLVFFPARSPDFIYFRF